MKVKVISWTDEERKNRDYRDIYIIEIDGKNVFEVGDGEPEDSNLSRDFNDVFGIPKMLEEAFNAGKRSGEKLEIEYEEVDEY